MKIGVIGVGNMGSALVRGLLASGKAMPEMISVFDIDPAKAIALQQELNIQAAEEIGETIGPETDILILAVKPQIMEDVVLSIADKVNDRLLVISVAAGISTGFILSLLNFPARIIRAMPNAAAMVGASATALCKAGSADEGDLGKAVEVFSAIGLAVTVEERMMNVVTALSGSGPGYLFPIMEALTDGAVLMGLDRPTARALAGQTVMGAAIMALSGDEALSDLKDRITSPGGTTIAGLQIMERAGLRGILMDTVQAATRRADELEGKK
jgi:pyrroline-5-carboxylate reductase